MYRPRNDDVIARYESGRSINWIKNNMGLPRIETVKILESHGVKIRSHGESMRAAWSAMSSDELEAAKAPLRSSAKTRKRKKKALTKRIFGLLTNEHYTELRMMCEELGETQHQFVRRAVLQRMRTRRMNQAIKKRKGGKADA